MRCTNFADILLQIQTMSFHIKCHTNAQFFPVLFLQRITSWTSFQVLFAFLFFRQFFCLYFGKRGTFPRNFF